MTETVLDLLKRAENFGDIAHPGTNLGSAFITEGIRDFRSRESIKNEVWEALKDDNLSMISICGTGGVGKTTMVKELVQRVEREKLFDVVGMAVVSQTPNIKKIQGLPSRGERKGHKIMLTSRNMDECNKMESEKNITMKVLEKDEARDLFREMAGISNVQDLHHTATEIADECGGLPLAIFVPEDFNVPVEDLVRYGMGLRLFKKVENVHQARTRVYTLVDELKESFLLLEGKGYDYVKMHDIVRDVAISIASTDKQWHTLQSEAKMKEWREEDGYKHCIAISLLYEKISDQLNDLEYPKLELLQIWDDCWSPGLPNNVYAGMKELKVLALSSSFPSLLQSLDVLRNLRTLRLVVAGLEEGRSLEYIPSGVLLALSKLEELYLPYRFGNWEPMEDGRKTNASLSELDTHHMTALEISVPKASILPEVSVFRNLERFKICVGCTNEIVADRNYAKVLQLRDDASDIKETGMKVLMGKAEVLNLIKVINMKEVISTDECVEQGYLVDALQGIPRLPEIQLPYFGKLRELNIHSCHELKYFIPLSMAKGLRQLHKISVEICKEMEGIFNNSEVDDEVEFPELTDLKLRDLPNFRGFIINNPCPGR
ncbi:hypothetical protein GH714_016506 [Hevea brasiliensis]|uniref:NB-ARC domain-containing protein n=1 Tax=Hevea brasiliensis TaxID=3981 RepID=A0A6A6KTZ6_HEVBR|nr:hypothetical protein GH714_016506 [Hevea brasiliensis]